MRVTKPSEKKNTRSNTRTATQLPTARAPKGAAKSKDKGAAKKGGRLVEMWQWESLRPKLLCTMHNVMQADLPRLWSPRKPEESFCSLFIQTAVRDACLGLFVAPFLWGRMHACK